MNMCWPGSLLRIIYSYSELSFSAQEKGKYEIITGTLKSADEMIDVYRDIVARYPALVMLIDPMRKEDREQWLPLCQAVTEK